MQLPKSYAHLKIWPLRWSSARSFPLLDSPVGYPGSTQFGIHELTKITVSTIIRIKTHLRFKYLFPWTHPSLLSKATVDLVRVVNTALRSGWLGQHKGCPASQLFSKTIVASVTVLTIVAYIRKIWMLLLKVHLICSASKGPRERGFTRKKLCNHLPVTLIGYMMPQTSVIKTLGTNVDSSHQWLSEQK